MPLCSEAASKGCLGSGGDGRRSEAEPARSARAKRLKRPGRKARHLFQRRTKGDPLDTGGLGLKLRRRRERRQGQRGVRDLNPWLELERRSRSSPAGSVGESLGTSEQDSAERTLVSIRMLGEPSQIRGSDGRGGRARGEMGRRVRRGDERAVRKDRHC